MLKQLTILFTAAALLAGGASAASKKRSSKKRTSARTALTVRPATPAVKVGDVPEIPESLDTPKHEMRGAWVATVYGIDWPSKVGTTAAVAAEQQREFIEILEVLRHSGVNAVMLQVRPMADAFYASSLEPWSAFVTGTRGAAPAEGWDPLKFAVDEAHRRGMELHAWVNPFRLSGTVPPPPAQVASGSGEVFDPVAKGWAISYSASRKGSDQPYTACILDPGNPEARKHIVEVCREIVNKYDVDGLLFDDYFYPDGLPLGGGYDFDEWQKQTSEKGAEPLDQAAWRRANVAKAVAAVADMLRRERPHVRFGISPAGVGGGNGKATEPLGLQPPTVGNDWMYDRIHCNPIDWLAAGTVDYVSPQIYWASNHSTNPYPPLAEWWADVAERFGRHSYPSQKVLALPASDAAWKEQGYQVGVNRRASNPDESGSIFYSTAHLSGKKARGLGDYLRQTSYTAPSLMPAMTWKEARNPGKVKDAVRRDNELTWYPQPHMRYVVYAVPTNLSPLDVLADDGRNFQPQYIVAITYGHSIIIPPDKLKGYWYAVAPYDRYGNEWEAAIINK